MSSGPAGGSSQGGWRTGLVTSTARSLGGATRTRRTRLRAYGSPRCRRSGIRRLSWPFGVSCSRFGGLSAIRRRPGMGLLRSRSFEPNRRRDGRSRDQLLLVTTDDGGMLAISRSRRTARRGFGARSRRRRPPSGGAAADRSEAAPRGGEGGGERMHEEARRCRGCPSASVCRGRGRSDDVRVQREPFRAGGTRRSLRDGTRFAKERLWHAEIVCRALRGPLVMTTAVISASA